MLSELLANPLIETGLPTISEMAEGRPDRSPGPVIDLLRLCPAAKPTPLQSMPDLARKFNVDEIWLKDESNRMGLGSFKALGAAYAIAQFASSKCSLSGPKAREELSNALSTTVFACASAGNHGLSVAAGARIFGASAVIYLSKAIPDAFEDRLRRYGARIMRVPGDYTDSMNAAARDAEKNGWILLSDSSWVGYTKWPTRVMQGYLVAAEEICQKIPVAPTHILLQAGVGGFAAAMTALFRDRWGDSPSIIVVEPDTAACVLASVKAGRPVRVSGPISEMGRLDCKEPSHIALAELANKANFFVSITDQMSVITAALLKRYGIPTTPSGAAGLSALQHAGEQRETLGFDKYSRVLAFVTEGPESLQ